MFKATTSLRRQSSDYNSSLNDDNEENTKSNYNTFIRYNNIGEYSDEYSSFLTERIKLTNKCCFKIINYWIRMNRNRNNRNNNFNFFFVLCISYCIEPEIIMNNCNWDNHKQEKEKIIKLLNTNQTFMIHSDKFRLGKNQKIINFKQLTKYHNINLYQTIPNINECNLCVYEFEIYQKYLNWKLKQMNYDRKYFPLSGSHKIGISSKSMKNNYFIGIYSYFNQANGLNNCNKYKRNGQMYSIDINGNKKLIKNQIAFRKHEIIHIQINWIQKQLIFKRISLKNNIQNNQIIINLKNIKLKKNKTKKKCLNINKFEWKISCSICLNDIDSFMWNNKDKDFITYTINQAYIL